MLLLYENQVTECGKKAGLPPDLENLENLE